MRAQTWIWQPVLKMAQMSVNYRLGGGTSALGIEGGAPAAAVKSCFSISGELDGKFETGGLADKVELKYLYFAEHLNSGLRAGSKKSVESPSEQQLGIEQPQIVLIEPHAVAAAAVQKAAVRSGTVSDPDAAYLHLGYFFRLFQIIGRRSNILLTHKHAAGHQRSSRRKQYLKNCSLHPLPRHQKLVTTPGYATCIFSSQVNHTGCADGL